jgi:hypothetical protein
MTSRHRLLPRTSCIRPGRQADFKIAPVAGHAFSEPGILDALVAATDRFALESDMTARSACPSTSSKTT